MKTLSIRWQRLLDEQDKTCPRCGSTEQEIDRACELLRRSFMPLSIEVVLEKVSLDRTAFESDSVQSNRIWISGKPLEEWLEAETGRSTCCGPCGDAECRTVELDNNTYEAVPASLIIKAGLRAAAEII